MTPLVETGAIPGALFAPLPIAQRAPCHVVPPVIYPIGNSPPAAVFDYPNHALMQAAAGAVSEFHDLVGDVFHFREAEVEYWDSRPGMTAAGFFQKLKHHLVGFNDVRTLGKVKYLFDDSAMGPLHMAVRRAIVRNARRAGAGENGDIPQTPILAIGAGWAYVEHMLSAMFGDMISIREISPKYAPLPEELDPIDVRYPPKVIEKAALPPNAHELAYGIFSSYYSGDQIDVLQKVAGSCRVGAEIFLMWKVFNLENMRLALLAENSGVFREGGLDVSVECVSSGSLCLARERVLVLWARKRREDVDARALFEKAGRARPLPGGGRGANGASDLAAPVRMSLDGPYFGSLLYARGWLLDVVEMMVNVFCDKTGIDARILHRKLTGSAAFKGGNGRAEDARRAIAEDALSDSMIDRLANGVPLSVLVMGYLGRVARVIDSGLTLPELERQELDRQAMLMHVFMK